MRPTVWVLALAALILALSACGAGEEDGAAEPSAVETADEAESPAEVTMLAIGETGFGPILVDATGRTLYLFADDPAGESRCLEECAAAWPPLIAGDELRAQEGVDAALLGTTERPDGTTQLTYNGHPLYFFVDDLQPGETNGQGVAGQWYVISPTGEAVETAVDESRDGGGPYG